MKNSTLVSASPFDGIDEELQLDFSNTGFFIDSGEASQKALDFFKKVKVNPVYGSKKVNFLPQGIFISDFKSLYEMARDEAKKAVASGETTEIVTGFIVHFGLDDVPAFKEVDLYFQPWFAYKVKKDEGRNTICSKLKVVQSSTFYTYSNINGFEPFQTPSSIDSYWNQLVIDSEDGSGNRRFRMRSDYKSDSKSAFMTFQQLIEFHKAAYGTIPYSEGAIFAFMGVIKKNYQIHRCKPQETDTANNSDENKVTLILTSYETYLEVIMKLRENRPYSLIQINQNNFTISESLEIDTLKSAQTELSLLIKSYELEENFKNLSGTGEAANLTGLCPPGCDGFEYKYL